MESEENKNTAEAQAGQKKKWLKYAGIGAFTFFLVKGLLWLIVPVALIWWGAR